VADTKFSEPLKSFRFLIEVEDGENKIVAAFFQFSGVKMHVDTVKVRTGADLRGVMQNIPALTHFQNVTLTRGVIGDSKFLEWILAAAPGATEAPTGKNKYRTINIIALGDKGQRTVTWSLFAALPVAYELGQMDSTQSTVLSEMIEFSISGFKQEIHLETPPENTF